MVEDLWNGASLIIHDHLFTDASGSWGCGAWHDSKWFQFKWDERMQQSDISVKELIPVIIAAAIWGDAWKGGRVQAHCDNMAVVAVINSRYSKDVQLMQMLRCLFFLEAHYQFKVSATHIAGIENDLADDLSRDNYASFISKMGKCDPSPSVIPLSLSCSGCSTQNSIGLFPAGQHCSALLCTRCSSRDS